MGIYFGFANAFGFTPEQVDNLDVFTLESFSIMADAQAKEQERVMRSGRRSGCNNKVCLFAY
ncbi:hypothetical protein LCGC14_1877000 [marine sediment metagenome]|uniref:Uncharacterized protein n=1 Tax=marine sediment metagenome TaxID=412755 RepID=A0A0F9G3B2_9ZZZZ